jgi:hypothetical protein
MIEVELRPGNGAAGAPGRENEFDRHPIAHAILLLDEFIQGGTFVPW